MITIRSIIAALVKNYLEEGWVIEAANHPCLSPSLAYVPCIEEMHYMNHYIPKRMLLANLNKPSRK